MARCTIHNELLKTYPITLAKMGKSFDCIAGKCPMCSRIYLNIAFFHHYDEVEINQKYYLYHPQLAEEYPDGISKVDKKPGLQKIYHPNPGDIVNLIPYDTGLSKKAIKKKNEIAERKPYKLVVLRKIDSEHCLVAIVKRSKKKTYLSVNTNRGSLFIETATFFSIANRSMEACQKFRFLDNKSAVIDAIYHSHSCVLLKEKQRKQLEERKKRIAAQKAKAAKKYQAMMDTPAQSGKKNNYELQYEIAVMNNDREKMRELDKKTGYIVRTGRYKTRNGKVLYSGFNPRPASGGMFTPK